MEQLHTVDEAAKFLRICPKTVREHLKAGKMRGVKIGRFWRIKSVALRDYVNNSKEMKNEKPSITTGGNPDTG